MYNLITGKFTANINFVYLFVIYIKFINTNSVFVTYKRLISVSYIHKITAFVNLEDRYYLRKLVLLSQTMFVYRYLSLRVAKHSNKNHFNVCLKSFKVI